MPGNSVMTKGLVTTIILPVIDAADADGVLGALREQMTKPLPASRCSCVRQLKANGSMPLASANETTS